MGLSLRKAAAALGISHVALLKAKKAGRIKAEADGTFDVEACRAELAKNSNPGKQKNARAQQKTTEPAISSPIIDRTGERVVIAEGHPHEGKSGTVVGYEILRLLPHLGPRARVKLDDGLECFAAPSQLGPATGAGLIVPQIRAPDTGGEPEGEETYNEACRQLEWIKVEKAKLELEVKRGQLVALVEVNAFIAGMIMRARNVLTRIDCDDRTKREIERALRELAEFEGNEG